MTMTAKRTTSTEQQPDDAWQLVYNIVRQLHIRLTKAHGYTSAMKENSFDTLLQPEILRGLLQRTNSEQALMLRLMNDTLDLVSAAQSTTTGQCEPTLVNALCREVTHELGEDILFRSDVPDTYAPTCDCDTLRRVLVRLLTIVSGRNEQIYLTITEPNGHGHLTFTVTSAANPMDADEAQRAFVLPQEPDAPDVARRMGLCLVRRLVRLMGGDIHIDPDCRDGLRFIFDIDVQ